MENTITKPARNTKKVVATIMTPDYGFIELFEYADSGRVITRDKVDTITGVPHPGIVIGIDRYGRIWVAHNHRLNGLPTYDVMEKYLDKEEMRYDNRSVKYTRSEIVRRAIAEVEKGKGYFWLTYNCQIFVNLVVRNEHVSESVDKFSHWTMLIGFVTTIMGLIFKKNTVTIAGLGILIIGGAAKGISRM